jgi:hypothetical protein
MILRKKKRANKKISHAKPLTMQEAMDYLTKHGISCQSRKTFYRFLQDFDIPYVNINPEGKYEVRRFPLKGLQDFLRSNGITIIEDSKTAQ